MIQCYSVQYCIIFYHLTGDEKVAVFNVFSTKATQQNIQMVLVFSKENRWLSKTLLQKLSIIIKINLLVEI